MGAPIDFKRITNAEVHAIIHSCIFANCFTERLAYWQIIPVYCHVVLLYEISCIFQLHSIRFVLLIFIVVILITGVVPVPSFFNQWNYQQITADTYIHGD